MGNCISHKSDDEDYIQNSPQRRQSNRNALLSPEPTPQQTPQQFARPEQFSSIYTIPTQQQTETIDSNGYTVLSQNPHLRYKANSFIQNDNYLGKIYHAHLCDKKISLKEFSSEQSINREAVFLRLFEHVNVVKFLLQFEALNQRFFLATEFAERLSRGLHLKNDTLKQSAMSQLASAVQYLQKSRIVHCQIIPENVFVVREGSACTFKLANFSRAVVIKAPSAYQGDFIEEYTAPEIRGRAIVHFSSDIWSLACVFFFIYTAQKMLPIVYENQMGKLAARIRTINDESAASAILLKDLLSKMLMYQPNQRLSADDVQTHPYFWSARQMTDFIVDASRMMEKDDKTQKVLSKGSHRVFGESWVARIEENVMSELQAIKKSYKNGGANNNSRNKGKDEYNEKSIRSLITTIRNISVHARSPIIAAYMGESEEQLMDYWNDKFPNLIEHMHNAMSVDNKENINNN